MTMALAVCSGFALALLAPFTVRLFGHRAGWILAILPAALFVYFGSLVGSVSEGQNLVYSLPWVPDFQIYASFYVDGLSLLFALLISGIGAFIVIYSGGYLKGHPHQGRFFGFILAFMSSMLGLVLADNVITLFVFWELTSITSFLLIGFDHHRMAARRAALQALVITGAGGLVLLAGLLLMAQVAGTLEMSQLLTKGDLFREHPWYLAMFLLVLGGAFTKSAQVPLHSWLPNAMEAPTPVSAYLHSATMVKAGVYLLMRVNPILGGTPEWGTVLPIFGGATLIAGTLLAVRQTDLKLMLAYTTVASLGLLVMLTGIGSDKAILGAVLYLFAHSLFKGALFMIAGCVDHESGTRDITKLGGLRSVMPISAAAAALAALSMAGIPPFIGFVGKEVIYAGLQDTDPKTLLLAATELLGNGLMLAVGAAVAIKPFWGERVATPKPAHEGPLSLWLGPVLLAVLGLLSALSLSTLGQYLIGPMTYAVAGKTMKLDLHLWAGFNTALLLSVVTIALGGLIYLVYDRLRDMVAALLDAIGWGPDKGFDQAISGLTSLSRRVTVLIQSGQMRSYLRLTFIITAVALLVPLTLFSAWPTLPALPDLLFYEWGVLGLALLGVVAVMISKTRLQAIVSLGIQGFAVALIFMLFGAADLSFTQFMVETLSVVILALVLTRLKLDKQDTRRTPSIFIDGTIAVACAIGFGGLLLAVTQQTLDLRLSEFFAQYSATIAHGRNIVNVILVDFRALDTLGEITVVMAAGLAALALIRLRPKGKVVDEPENDEESTP